MRLIVVGSHSAPYRLGLAEVIENRRRGLGGIQPTGPEDYRPRECIRD